MGDRDVSGTAKKKKKVLLCLLCSCQVVFEQFCGGHLHIQSERWRSSMEMSMDDAGETETEKFL